MNNTQREIWHGGQITEVSKENLTVKLFPIVPKIAPARRIVYRACPSCENYTLVDIEHAPDAETKVLCKNCFYSKKS